MADGFVLDTELRDAQTARDELRVAIDMIPGQVWTSHADGYVDFVNQRWCEYTGLTLDEAEGWGWQNALCPEDLPGLLKTWKEVRDTNAPGEAVARLRRADGVDRWFLFRAIPFHDAAGKLVKWYGTTTDIEERIYAERLLAGEKRILEMMAKALPLTGILEALCRLAEEMSTGLITSIRLLDRNGERLLHGMAPNLPSAGACWSYPIVSEEGTVLGTLAMYSRLPGEPSIEQHNLIEQVISLARIAIEQSQAEEALRRSEAYQAEAQRLSLTGSFSWNPGTGELIWSDETYRIYGFDNSIKATLDLARERLHPDDVAVFERAKDQADDGELLDFAHRLLMPDGTVKYLQIVSRAILDEAGNLVEYVGAVRDVTAQQRAERALRRARIRGIESQYNAMMEERTRLAREIHDTVLQGFNGVTLMLLAAARKVDNPPEAVASLQHVLDLAEKTLGDARRVVWDLRGPSVSGDFANTLRAAAEDAVRGTELSLDFIIRGSPRAMDSKSEAVAFRVLQEAIANTLKHAEARRVRVSLSYLPRGVRLAVRDDGRGFTVDPDFRAYGGHWGLLGMWERASQVAARLRIRSKPGVGTEVSLRLA